MIADVTLERAIYQGPPNKFEAGTATSPTRSGWAPRCATSPTWESSASPRTSTFLLEYATPRLAAIPGVPDHRHRRRKASVLSFVLAGHEPLEVGKALNAEGIAIARRAPLRAADSAPPRVEQTVRPSFAFYNTTDEIDLFIDVVDRLARGGI